MAVIIFALAVLSGLALPQSGLLDFAMPLWRPCTIAERIQAANLDEAVGSCPAGNGADVIELHEDLALWARLPNIRSEITIEGNDHTISGDGKVGMFSVLAGGKLKIMRAQLTKGAGGQLAGAIEIRGGVVHLVDVTISDSAMDRGAAITLDGGRLYMRDSEVLGRTDIRSHAITNEDGSVSLVDTTIEGFHFDFRGGAIINNGSMTIAHSVIRKNSAMSGAAIYNRGKLDIRSATFAENAADLGGALHNYRADVTIADSQFVANRAKGQGGAIFSRETPIRINRSEFSLNSAEEAGAIGGMDTWLTIRDSEVSNNSAEEKGGGLKILNGSLRIEGSKLLGNDGLDGGGIYSENARLTISDNVFRGNRADRGGGIYYAEGVIVLRDSVFQSNCARVWGANLYTNAVELTESGNAFEDSQFGDCDD